MEKKLVQEINKICPPDYYEIGFAYLGGLLNPKWQSYSYGISILIKLNDPVIDDIKDGPTPDYYNLYNEVNDELNSKTDEIVALLKAKNIDAVGVKATLDDREINKEYRNTLRFSLSHKMVATQAGLGWIGKTDLLISKRFGPRARLSSILTTSSIAETGKPINQSQCGSCNICVQKCPAKAAKDILWASTIDRDQFYNPFKCREYAQEISSTKINKRVSLCGICVSVCPQGKR